MLFERINASGVGLTIGSIGTSVVNNITFRDCFMYHTWKVNIVNKLSRDNICTIFISLQGIYMKFRGGDETKGGRISNVLYENIWMEAPEQFAIWIGPAQQYSHPCSIFWPQLADYVECAMEDKNFIYENITLRNITIVDPKFSYGQGVILGNPVTPMKVNISTKSFRVLIDARNIFRTLCLMESEF